MLARIVSFWCGPVSYLERIAAASMRAQGHAVVVYSYTPEVLDAAGLGVEVRDARQVLPFDDEMARIARVKPAVLADIIRLEFMRRSLGVWLDLDIVLVAPLPAPDTDMFAIEGPSGKINNAALYLHAESVLLADLLDFVHRRPVMAPWWTAKRRIKHKLAQMIGRPIGPQDSQWGVFGPKALTWFVDQRGLRATALDPKRFYPVTWDDRSELIEALDVSRHFTAATIGVHLWANGLRRMIAADGVHDDSFLAKAAKAHGIALPGDIGRSGAVGTPGRAKPRAA